MRLLYASSALLPSRTANSIQVMRMCDAFAEIGHTVQLLARPGDLGHEPHSWYGTSGRFEIDSTIRSDVRAVGIPLTAWRVGRRARRWEADLVYGRDPVGLLGAATFGVPVMLEVHHPPETRSRAAIERALLRTRGLRRVVAISGALAEHYRRRAPGIEVVVAHDGADDPGEPRAETDASHAVVGYVGSLSTGKGGSTVVELARRLPDVAFRIVGGRPDEVASFRNDALPANLQVTGHVPPAEVSAEIRDLIVALAPYEARVFGAAGAVDLAAWMSPLKVFEYLAHAVPVVASDLPVLREVLADEWNALLVPPGDLDRWEAAVRRLLADERLRTSLRAGARATFESGLSWTARAARAISPDQTSLR